MLQRSACALSIVSLLGVAQMVGAAPATRSEFAYVANGGNNNIQLIDLATGKTLRRIYAGAGPWRLRRSPDGEEIWAQHWHSQATAVISTRDHQIQQVLPLRGPGVFTGNGTQFLSFDWPDRLISVVDRSTHRPLHTLMVDFSNIYDLAPSADGKRLYLLPFDPLDSSGARYRSIVSQPLPGASPGALGRGRPSTWRTGPAPISLVASAHEPFVLSADHGTNGLGLFNQLGDARSISTCRAPRGILLSPDESRMVVLCWEGKGRHTSQLVAYDADFSQRPWPEITRRAEVDIAGGLVAGRFSAGGKSVFVLDQAGERLLEIDIESLGVTRTFSVGDVPMDVEIISASTPSAPIARQSTARALLERTVKRMQTRSAPFDDLPSVQTHTEPQPGEQDLVSVIYNLPNLSLDAAIRELAGDVPGSPYLRNGLAVDLVRDVEKDDRRFVVIGAPGEHSSQLWVDAATAEPVRLIEKVSRATSRVHVAEPSPGEVETRFYDFVPVGGGVTNPTRLE